MSIQTLFLKLLYNLLNAHPQLMQIHGEKVFKIISLTTLSAKPKLNVLFMCVNKGCEDIRINKHLCLLLEELFIGLQVHEIGELLKWINSLQSIKY